MNTININKHTIILTIGPSNSGKSYLVNNHLIPFLKENGIHHQYLRSDAIRQDLLGADLHKHDRKMISVSKQAFELLHTQLDVYTQYPVNTPVVIVDATNLSKTGRSFVEEIAEKNHYNLVGIVFNYTDKEDYFKYTDEGTEKRVIADMIKTLQTSTLKEIDKKKYQSISTIKSIDFSDVKFSYNDESTHGLNITHPNYCVVGDIHGCLEELITVLLDNKGIAIENGIMSKIDGAQYIHHVLVGDLVDKGQQTKEVVEFIYDNREFFDIIEGNHERWVYNYLKGKIKADDSTANLIDNWFDSVKLFEADEVLKEKFFALYESMSTYAYNDKVVVTHAPCRNKYLLKEDKVALKKMNTIMYPKQRDYDDASKYMDAMEDFFQFLIDDAEPNVPFHVFGHVMADSVFNQKNKYAIDTGCVVGGQLSTLIFFEDSRRPLVKKYASTREKTKELHPFFRVKSTPVGIGSLDIELAKRVKWAAKNGVNFMSGTMSPVDKDFEIGDIENIWKGVDYYRNSGVNHIVMQPKFMGSRCNIMLHRNDPSKCRAISRNGFEIKESRLADSDITLEELYMGLQERYADLFEDKDAEYILFDGELLPWTIMGKKLIENDFVLPYNALKSELNVLAATGFQERWADAVTKFDDDAAFEKSGVPSHLKSFKKSYDAIKDEMLPFDVIGEHADKYIYQVNHFAKKGNTEFKPFAILKIVKRNGEEENCISSSHENITSFLNLSHENILILDYDRDVYMIMRCEGNGFTPEYFDSPGLAVDTYWSEVTQNKEMEGVVIKPERAYVPGVAPYLKCRNKEYIRLVYGFDYDCLPVKSQKLLNNKSIKRKLSTSIKEYELGRALLDIPYNEISITNEKWLGLIIKLMNEQEGEKELDPRL